MVLCLKVKFRHFAVNFYDRVVFLFAGQKVFVWDIRQNGEHIENFSFKFFRFFIEFRYFFAERTHFGEYFIHGFTRFFERGNFRRNLISLRLIPLHFGDDGAAFFVGFKYGIEIHSVAFSR